MRAMDVGAGREPGSGHRAQARLRDFLGLYPAFRAFAVLCLRLRLWRLPGELALCGLRKIVERICGAISRNAVGRRHQASLRAAGPLWTRRPRSEVLGWRAECDC